MELTFDAFKMESFLKKQPELNFLAECLVKSGFEKLHTLKIIFNAYVQLNPVNTKVYNEGENGN